jgi:hypothetical protein
MEGCRRREKRAWALSLATGWHAANFSRGKQLKNLDHYLRQLEPQEASPADEAAAIFAGFAERGLVKIRERRKDEG